MTGFRLSPAQNRVLALHADDGRGPMARCVARLDGPLDTDRLRRAVQQVWQDHEILRTTFARLPGVSTPVQLVHEAVQAALVESEAPLGPPADLEDAPLVRARLARLGTDHYELEVSGPAVCLDGSSLKLLLRAVASHYRGEPAGPDDVLQYADVAAWLNEFEGGAGDVSAPSDPHPSAAQRVEAVLEAARVAAVEEFCAAEDIHPSDVLLACWQLLVSQLRREDDGIFVRTDGRTHPDLVEVLGPLDDWEFLDQPGGDPRALGEYVRSVGSARRRLGEHAQGGPAGGTGISGTAFAYDDASAVMSLGDGLELHVLGHACEEPWPDLVLECLRRADDLALTVRGRGADQRVLALLLERLVALVEQVGAWREVHTGELDLLPSSQRAELMELGRGGPSSEGTCVHELVAAQAQRAADLTALVLGDDRLSYRETDEAANQLAHLLRDLGVVPGEVVAICGADSLDLVVGVLAVWKAGAAYLPLPAGGGPDDRLREQLDRARVRWVLAAPGQGRVFDELPVTVVPLARDDDSWRGRPRTPPAVANTPDDVAYCVYTSGSTGGPKGVLVTHRAVANLRGALRSAVHGVQAPPRRVAQNSPFTFDAWVQQLVTLCDGDTLHLLPEELRRDDRKLVDHVRSERIEVMNGTPSHVGPLVAAGLLDPSATHRPERLLIAGEIVGPALWRDVATQAPGRAFNIYGPTEATVNATAALVTLGDTPNVGRPIPGYEALVLDPSMRPLPIGAPGELYLGGPGLARGYVGSPGLTAAAFVPHPSGDRPGARLYRTGDLARWRGDGSLDFLGRGDQQVKLRGYRIEPGEVAQALQEIEGLAEAVVVLHEDQYGPRLAAYLVASGPRRIEDAELRRRLSARVPDYMVPSAFVWLATIPLTPHGKLDRAQLPAVRGVGRRADVPFVPPRSFAERQLAQVWEEVLDVDAVGVDDNFFDLGGDSIRAIRVRARAVDRGLDFSIHTLFQAPTVSKLAALAQPTGATSVASPGAGGAGDRAAPGHGMQPTTHTQSGMLFQDAFHPASALFRNTRSAHLRGPFEPAAARVALAEMVARHPALRTSFDLVTPGGPFQVVHETAILPLELGDIAHLAPAEQEAHLDRYCAEQRARPFLWSEPPLLRLAMHRRGPDSFQATLTVHEAVLDGWSVALFVGELLQRYRSAVLEPGAPPPAFAVIDPATTTGAMALLEHDLVEDPSALAFWAAYLTGAPDGRVVARGEQPGAHMMLVVPIAPSTATGLKALATRLGVPLKSVLLAVHGAALGDLMGGPEVLTGLVTNIRAESKGADETLGQFLNTLPLRLACTNQTWEERVRDALEAEVGLLPHRRFPAAYLAGPRYRSAFNYTHFHALRGVLGAGLELVADEFVERTDLSLLADFSVDAETDEVRLTINCGGLNDADRDRAVSAYHARLVDAGAGGVVMVSPTPGEEPEARAAAGVLAELEARADVAPDALAVSCGGVVLTYARLHARANRLARLLRSQGVTLGSVVPLVAARDADLVVALLAVLKAGASALLLDAIDPPARLDEVISRSGSQVLVTAAGGPYTGPEGVTVVAADDPRADVLEDDHLGIDASVHDLAYVVLTSGSTGVPRLVQVEHGSLANHVRSKVELLGLTERDTVAVVTRPGFDVVVWQLLAPLSVGARVELVPEAQGLDRSRLVTTLSAAGASVVTVTPRQLEAMLDDDATAAGLRRVVVTGEPLAPELAASWSSRHPHATLVNAYGTAETTDNVTHHVLEASDGSGSPRFDIPVGSPLPGAFVRVLDHRLLPVPVGVTGDVYVGGAAMARGYLGEPSQTALRFVPDPLRSGARMVRTGDRGYLDARGLLHHVGRSDRQVKVNGVRVEPAEVELALLAHPDVAEAVVTTVPGPDGAARLVAHVAPAAVADRPDRLRAHLLSTLPLAMIPSQFVDMVPSETGPRGKVLPRDLREVSWVVARHGVRTPADPLERRLAELWGEVLQTDAVDRDADFFELGGTSVAALVLSARISVELGADLPVREIFLNSTIAMLAEWLTPAGG